jgi:hypothetical protein
VNPEDRPDLIDDLTFRRVDFGAGYDSDARPAVTDLYEANVVTSTRTDLDVTAHLVPSTTPGHSHLYADVACSWEDYRAFLKAAAKVGLLEEGYVNASEQRGYTSVRLPWVRKTSDDFLFGTAHCGWWSCSTRVCDALLDFKLKVGHVLDREKPGQRRKVTFLSGGEVV